MRRKKHKNTQRVVRFYKLHYNFRDPYKVLLDGNFMHVTRLANLSNLGDHIPNLLGSKCKLYVTPCVMHELKSLGDEFHDTLRLTRKHNVHKCGHDTPLSAAECLLSQTGTRNEQHWWIATQDQTLKESLGKIPGCPCIFASVNGLHLNVPSDVAKALAKQEEIKHQVVQEHEKQTEALKDLDELTQQSRGKEKSIFRRRKAKGPNPLAVKKRKKSAPGVQKGGRPGGQVSGGQFGANEQAGGEGKKKRRRKKGAAAGGGADGG